MLHWLIPKWRSARPLLLGNGWACRTVMMPLSTPKPSSFQRAALTHKTCRIFSCILWNILVSYELWSDNVLFLDGMTFCQDGLKVLACIQTRVYPCIQTPADPRRLQILAECCRPCCLWQNGHSKQSTKQSATSENQLCMHPCQVAHAYQNFDSQSLTKWGWDRKWCPGQRQGVGTITKRVLGMLLSIAVYARFV